MEKNKTLKWLGRSAIRNSLDMLSLEEQHCGLSLGVPKVPFFYVHL